MNALNRALKARSLVRYATSLVLSLLAGTVASAQNSSSLSAVPFRTPDRS
jgi:hypothetical protein